MQDWKGTEVTFASTKFKTPLLFGNLQVHEHDFRHATGTGLPSAKGDRAAGSGPVVTSVLPRSHLPNRQELRLRGKCAPSSPLRLMVTRRAEDAMVHPAVSPKRMTEGEGGVASP